MAKIILTIVLGVALFFRLHQISSVPPSPSLDEVSLGWNAYSLFKTGYDEFGTKLPVLLRAYDDYRPALYTYLIIPFIPIIGLTTSAVRMPSIVLSLITIISTFFIVKVLTKNSIAGLSAAFFLAISPWHIYISRLGHEANAGLAAGVVATTLFFYSINNKTKKWVIVISALTYVTALYSYQSQKIIIPILLVSLTMLFYKKLLKIKYIVAGSILLSFILLVPLATETFSDTGLVRFHGTSVLNGSHPLYEKTKEHFVAAKKERNIIKQVINYPRFTSIRIASEQYLLHFSPTWLFYGTSDEAHKIPFMGLLHLWELPLIIIGFYAAYTFLERKVFIFFLIWFFSSPLPASITTQAPHAMRSYTFLPLWQILSGFGLVYIVQMLRERTAKITVMVVVFTCALFSMKDIMKNYFSVFPVLQSNAFSYPNSQIFPYVMIHEHEYQKIVIEKKLGERYAYPSYMFFLFFTRYDPKRYLTYGGTQSGSFDADHFFGKYEFRNIKTEERDTETLYVSNYTPVSDGRNIQYIGMYKDGKSGVSVYDYK